MKNCFYCHSRMSDSAKVCSVCGKSAGYTREVLDRAAKGDKEIRRELYLRTRESVHDQLLSQGMDPDHVTETMRRLYADAYQNLTRLHNPETFPDLMMAMAKRESEQSSGTSAGGARVSRPAQTQTGTAQTGASRSSGSTANKGTGNLQEVMALLTLQQRRLITMHYQDKLSVEEIARQTGARPEEIKAQIAAAAAVVSKHVKAEEGKPEYTFLNVSVPKEVKARAMGQDPAVRARTEAARQELEERSRSANRPVQTGTQQETRTRTQTKPSQVREQSDVRTYNARQPDRTVRQNPKAAPSSKPDQNKSGGKKNKPAKSSPVVKAALVIVTIIFVIMVVFFVRELADRFYMLFRLFS